MLKDSKDVCTRVVYKHGVLYKAYRTVSRLLRLCHYRTVRDNEHFFLMHHSDTDASIQLNKAGMDRNDIALHKDVRIGHQACHRHLCRSVWVKCSSFEREMCTLQGQSLAKAQLSACRRGNE
jgi:hypothetical protein